MKEQSDDRERELKFGYRGDLEVLVDQLRRVARPQWSLITFPPRAIMDLYFDDEEGTFRRVGATLRLRKRRINPGWTVNFKSPADPCEADFVDRREVITRVRIDEALLHRGRRVPGLAWRCAVELLHETTPRSAALSPTVYLATWRTGWTIRTGDLGDRQANYLSLFHDEVRVVDLDGQDPDRIIRYGALDYTASAPRGARFEEYEIEASGRRAGEEAAAVASLRAIARRLAGRPDVTVLGQNKYQRALSVLEARSG